MLAVAILIFLASAVEALAQIPRDFVDKTVPKKYPQLITYIRTNGPQKINWTTESREKQSMSISLTNDNHLVVEAEMFFGSASTASSTKEKTRVVMTDRKLDGMIGRLEATPPGGNKQFFENPRDEGSMFLWYSSLAIAFSRSPCCSK